MRILLQRVKCASVTIEDKEVARIGRGLLLFAGFCPEDDFAVAQKMADKVLKLRVFEDQNGKTNLSLDQVQGELLCVSQFTLYGSAKEGNRPAFVGAMKPDEARILYGQFYAYLQSRFPSLQGGVFQADMQVILQNDGPFTLMLDSKELFGK